MSNRTYKWLTLFLVTLLGVTVLILARTQIQLNRTKSDVRFAREIIESFHSYRDLALKSDAVEATYYLRKLQMPPGAAPFQNIAADFVERERKRVVKEIIANLRTQTGKELGDDPQKWIDAFDTNGGQKAR